MVEFIDGRAQGTILMLQRVPLYLRVVIANGEKSFDALDQLDDKPTDLESITVYRRRDDILEPSKYHILCSRGRGGSNPTGWYWYARYSVVAPQPTEAEIRNNEAWQRWATAQGKPDD